MFTQLLKESGIIEEIRKNTKVLKSDKECIYRFLNQIYYYKGTNDLMNDIENNNIPEDIFKLIKPKDETIQHKEYEYSNDLEVNNYYNLKSFIFIDKNIIEDFIKVNNLCTYYGNTIYITGSSVLSLLYPSLNIKYNDIDIITDNLEAISKYEKKSSQRFTNNNHDLIYSKNKNKIISRFHLFAVMNFICLKWSNSLKQYYPYIYDNSYSKVYVYDKCGIPSMKTNINFDNNIYLLNCYIWINKYKNRGFIINTPSWLEDLINPTKIVFNDKAIDIYKKVINELESVNKNNILIEKYMYNTSPCIELNIKNKNGEINTFIINKKTKKVNFIKRKINENKTTKLINILYDKYTIDSIKYKY